MFDSNIVIDAIDGNTIALEIFERSVAPAISVVTWMEVMAGTTVGREESEIRSFLARFTILPMTGAVTEESVRVRRGSRIKLMDAIILATARVHGRVLVTRNTKDFPQGMAGVWVPYTF